MMTNELYSHSFLLNLPLAITPLRYFSFSVLAIALAGCANDYNWVTSRSDANFQQDLDACVRITNAGYDAKNATNPEISETYVPPINSACAGNFGLFGCNNGMPDTVSNLDRCLMSKGWHMKRAP